MESVLNLKLKDFVFIDDRPDEIDMVHSVYPSIQCLDALSPVTWRLIDFWEKLVDDANGMDRTQMYREREHRSDFLNTIDTSTIDEVEIFKNLGLVLSLMEVKNSELKRTVELINRTNQFNMRASRTSFNEAQQWLNLEDITVIQARMSDKFGDMGIVSIIVFEKKENSIEILVFVLSCRVFGYKVEVAILNEVKRRAQQKGVKEIRGEYIATASNSPCSLVYSDAQFVKKEGCWLFPVSDKIKVNEPEWLKIITM
jgi:FkbH-like protein